MKGVCNKYEIIFSTTHDENEVIELMRKADNAREKKSERERRRKRKRTDIQIFRRQWTLRASQNTNTV